MTIERLPVDPESPEAEGLARIARIVRDGGVVAYPTETFYALGANALDGHACERVYTLKGRPAEKALPLILSHVEQLDAVSDFRALSSAARELARRFWPGPLTLVVPCRPGIPAAAGGQSLAVRVSALPLARELAAAVRAPLTATSANPSGAAPASTADEVERLFPSERSPACLVDGGATPGGLPSTVVDVTGERPALIREGRVPFQDVLAALRG